MKDPVGLEQVLKTPFHARAAALCLGNQWGRWAGYTTVQVFTTVEEEYFAIRNAATLFDLSPMIKYRIHGPDAMRYLDRLVTRSVSRIAVGQAAYVVWCDDAGKVLDDGTLFRLGETEFQLNAQERHLCWLRDGALGYDVTIEDSSAAIAALALQGPTSCAVLKALDLADIETLPPYRLRSYALDGAPLTVSRTGFTGDLGYELWTAPETALALWDALVEAGRPHGLRAIGGAALEMARVEAGFIQTNGDFVSADAALRPSRGRSPFEIGLGWMVDFDKGHFNGRRALLAERARGSRYRLVGLDIDYNKPAVDTLIYRRRRRVGQVTSALWSPTCKRNLAIATLDADCPDDGLWADIYVAKELKWERIKAACRVVPRPFFNPARRWATPAGDR